MRSQWSTTCASSGGACCGTRSSLIGCPLGKRPLIARNSLAILFGEAGLHQASLDEYEKALQIATILDIDQKEELDKQVMRLRIKLKVQEAGKAIKQTAKKKDQWLVVQRNGSVRTDGGVFQEIIGLNEELKKP